MTTNELVLHADPATVWEVLSDGWLYPLWVVGASRVRDVEGDWPAVGARIHHSVGSWPLLIDDNTEVLEVHPPDELVLRARAWPTGEARIHMKLTPVGPHTNVTINEDASSGPALLIPRPLRHLALRWRNTESLRRLAFVAEGRQA